MKNTKSARDKMSNAELSCLVCASTAVEYLTVVDDRFKLVKCTRCELVFAMPRPGVEELKEYYNTEFSLNYEPIPRSEADASSSVKNIHKLIKSCNLIARNILEIGCSYGHKIYGLKQCGYEEVAGTDISLSACRYASKHYNLKVYNSEFPPNELIGYYDVVILSHVIEHVLDPLDFLKKSSSYLKKGGIVFIETPNIDSILFYIFGKHFEQILPPRHISFFNPKSIEMLSSMSGLACIRNYTRTPIWFADCTFFNCLFLSALRLFRITQVVRRRINPSSKHALACTTGIVCRSRILSKFRLVVNFSTKALSLLSYPILKMLDQRGKGILLIVVAKKQ